MLSVHGKISQKLSHKSKTAQRDYEQRGLKRGKGAKIMKNVRLVLFGKF